MAEAELWAEARRIEQTHGDLQLRWRTEDAADRRAADPAAPGEHRRRSPAATPAEAILIGSLIVLAIVSSASGLL